MRQWQLADVYRHAQPDSAPADDASSRGNGPVPSHRWRRRLGGQQAVLAHHKLGTVGVDRTKDAGFSSQFGNTLRIIAEQLGRQVHPPRTESAQPGKRGPIRAEHRRRHVKCHAQLASDHHLSQVAADDAPGTLHQ